MPLVKTRRLTSGLSAQDAFGWYPNTLCWRSGDHIDTIEDRYWPDRWGFYDPYINLAILPGCDLYDRACVVRMAAVMGGDFNELWDQLNSDLLKEYKRDEEQPDQP